ncbi:MAG: TonB-dependent receptor, partial [Cellvibrionaceae bacterium]|nr:TonB-dependent receptor [Cellvibrionaceae bacterium]
MIYSTPTLADDQEIFSLEEIIVTAQKREESLQEVPISIATLSGEKLDDAGIENLQDLTAHLPSIHFTETGLSTQVRVRGIGSDNSQGFEQSVGMYIDGIYYGRAQLFRIPLMDLERAELLRGPQSILFGKNSIAGALNLQTARPADELTGSFAASQEFLLGETELNGVVSVPMSEEFRARLAVRKYEETGYINNTVLDADQPFKEETSLRLSMDWDASDKLHILAKGETHRFKTKGRPIEVIQDLPLIAGSPNFTQTLTAGFGVTPFDAQLNYERQADLEESSDNEVNNMTFITTYQFAENTLTWTAGLLDFDTTELCDCDFIPAEILNLELEETYEQQSQEIRLASPKGRAFEWVVGAFYQNWEQTFFDQLAISETGLVPAASPDFGIFRNTALRREFEQSSDTWAVFGQVNLQLTNKLFVSAGARYTAETKEATKAMDAIELETNTISTNPALGFAYLEVFGAETNQANVSFVNGVAQPLRFSGHNVAGDRDESAITPLFSAEYYFSDTTMFYGLYTTGFKAGGFDPRSNRVGSLATTDPNATEDNPNLFFEFEEETVTSIELGLKTSFASGRGEFNLAIFDMQYEDLQISQFDGQVGFNVGNARETSVSGVEIDGRWLFNQSFTASYNVAFLDFEYDDFQNGNCFAGQTPDGIDLNGDGQLNT